MAAFAANHGRVPSASDSPTPMELLGAELSPVAAPLAVHDHVLPETDKFTLPPPSPLARSLAPRSMLDAELPAAAPASSSVLLSLGSEMVPPKAALPPRSPARSPAPAARAAPSDGATMDMLLRLTARIVTVQESLAKSMADRVAADMDLASIWRTVSMSVATAAVNAVSKAKVEPAAAAKKRKLPEAAQATPETKKPRTEATSKKLQEIDAQIKEMNAQRKAKREAAAAAAAAMKKSKPEEDEEDEEPKPRKHKHSSQKKKKHSKPAGESDSEDDDDEASLNSDSAL